MHPLPYSPCLGWVSVYSGYMVATWCLGGHKGRKRWWLLCKSVLQDLLMVSMALTSPCLMEQDRAWKLSVYGHEWGRISAPLMGWLKSLPLCFQVSAAFTCLNLAPKMMCASFIFRCIVLILHPRREGCMRITLLPLKWCPGENAEPSPNSPVSGGRGFSLCGSYDLPLVSFPETLGWQELAYRAGGSCKGGCAALGWGCSGSSVSSVWGVQAADRPLLHCPLKSLCLSQGKVVYLLLMQSL